MEMSQVDGGPGDLDSMCPEYRVGAVQPGLSVPGRDSSGFSDLSSLQKDLETWNFTYSLL